MNSSVVGPVKGLTGGVHPHLESILYWAVCSSRSFTNGRQPFMALRLRYQQFDPTKNPVMGLRGFGDALISMAPAKILIA
jgi:hypothetical protein